MAVLIVVLFHAGLPVPGGFIGVDVFFVISGYVITAMLMREWANHGRIRFVRFYVRRFRRLIPALALVVAFTMVVSSLVLAPFGEQRSTALTGIGALLLSANLVIAHTSGGYFGQDAKANPLVNTWSLSVEEQFYLIFPAVLFLVWRMAARRGWSLNRSAIAALSLLGAGSLALALVQSTGAEVLALPGAAAALLDPFYSPLPRVWEFVAGAVVALAGQRLTLRSPAAGAVVGVLGLAGLVAASLLINSSTPWPGVWTILPVTASVALLLAGTVANPVARALSTRPAVYLGDISYSVYLWHWPMIVLAQHVWPDRWYVPMLAAIASFAPAIATYHLLEQPIRLMRDSGWPRFTRLVAAVSVPPLLLAGTLLVATNSGFWNPSVRHLQAAIDARHPAEVARCQEESWKNRDACQTGAERSGPPVYLVGDSQADHLAGGTEVSARALDRPLQILSEYGCGMVPTELTRYEEGRETRCNQWESETREFLAAAEPGTILLASSYLELLDRRERGSSPVHLSAAQQRTLLGDFLTEVITEFESAGHTVILVDPVPVWGLRMSDLEWSRCSVPTIANDRCRPEMPLVQAEDLQADAYATVAAVATETSVPVLDLRNDVCPDGTCRAVTGGDGDDGERVVYRDGYHLSAEESVRLAPRIEEALSSVG